VINAIYPEKEILPKHYFGHRYFVLRDEFIYTPPKEVVPEVKRVLVTFGGVDPNNLTHKVIDAIYSYTQAHGITIEVVAGFGYERYDTLAAYSDIVIHRNVAHIAKLMQQSDLIFTSAGRTIYEVAAMRTPAIVLAQNEREMTHLFASEEHGFMHLGLGAEVIPESIVSAFTELAEDHDRRKQMSQKMDAVDLHSGRERVIELIQTHIKEHR
jgi:spore coat polysaccharide biosynthesis predicted glycosyltransferase SpsG